MSVLLLATPAGADTNPTPIAVPLIGTQGVAAPYPSRITVTSRFGPSHTSTIRVRLLAVTHPCPEDLAILLVDVQVLNYQPIAVEKALYWNAGAQVFAGGTNVTATRMPPP